MCPSVEPIATKAKHSAARIAVSSGLRGSTLCAALALGLGIALLGGCTQPPRRLPPSAVERWSFHGVEAQRLRTPNYVIHTTLRDGELNQNLARLMEGALVEYRRLCPGVPPSDRPMDCYVFATRGDWEAHTRQTAGPDAAVYLQITKGGYALGDTFAAFYLGDNGTFTVASHEGFHQYVARHFRSRLPPFLEEGIACLFENVSWDSGRPSWNLSINGSRAMALRYAIDEGRLWPLEELISTHAGRVVVRSRDDIEAFYAQSWAFARFLNEGESGRHRPAFQRLLADAAAGRLAGQKRPEGTRSDRWDPDAAATILEHYLGMSLAQIEERYRAFALRIAPRE